MRHLVNCRTTVPLVSLFVILAQLVAPWIPPFFNDVCSHCFGRSGTDVNLSCRASNTCSCFSFLSCVSSSSSSLSRRLSFNAPFADIEISDNYCIDNEEGIRLSMGSSYNKIFDNTVLNTTGSEFSDRTSPPCGCSLFVTIVRGVRYTKSCNDPVSQPFRVKFCTKLDTYSTQKSGVDICCPTSVVERHVICMGGVLVVKGWSMRESSTSRHALFGRPYCLQN